MRLERVAARYMWGRWAAWRACSAMVAKTPCLDGMGACFYAWPPALWCGLTAQDPRLAPSHQHPFQVLDAVAQVGSIGLGN